VPDNGKALTEPNPGIPLRNTQRRGRFSRSRSEKSTWHIEVHPL